MCPPPPLHGGGGGIKSLQHHLKGEGEKFHFELVGLKLKGGWKIKEEITIVCSLFTFMTEASFSYKISYSHSTPISIIICLKVFLSV